MRRNNGDPRGRLAALLHGFGRLSLALTTVAATSITCLTSFPASAAPRHSAHHGHSGTARASARPIRATKRGQHQRSVARIRPVRSAAHYAGTMHRDAVPLVNATWDEPQIPPVVVDAIQTAAHESGVDPQLLAAIAWRESRFKSDARNSHSSAKGLLQFTTETWLQVVRNYGSQHDVGGYAAAIQKDQSGALVVSEKGVRAAILRLRSDPVLSAKLAAQNMRQQTAAMQDRLGRSVTPADLYLLHVLGPTGAARFLAAVAKHPSESSLEVASYDVMRNAGLLAHDGRPMTVANTYAAAGAMLKAQYARTEPSLSAPKVGSSDAATPGAIPEAIQVSAAP